VVEEVNKTAAYTGARTLTQRGNEYDHISIDSQTEEMLDRMWLEASKSLLSVGKQFVRVNEDAEATMYADVVTTEDEYNDVTSTTAYNDVVARILDSESDILTYAYLLPDNYNTAMDASIAQMCLSYIVQYIMAAWLQVCGMPQESNSYIQSATSLLKLLDGFLYARIYTRAAEGGESTLAQLGDKVTDIAGDGTSGETETATNQLGDKVTDIAGDGTSGETETATNQLGDKVTDIAGDGTSGETETATNQLGDIVGDLGDGTDSQEKECDNTIGFTLPQGWGRVKVEKFTLNRRRTDE